MKNAILLDVDGVLLNWFPGFKWWMQTHNYAVTEDTEPTEWDMSNVFPDAGFENIRREITRFNTSEAFGDLQTVWGAIEGVKKLRKLMPNTPIAALTAAGLNPRTVELRCKNIHRFNLDEIHITPLNVSKEIYLKHYFNPGCIYVEDNAKHAMVGAELGHKVFLLDYPYNQEAEHKNIVRCKGWGDITTRLTDAFKKASKAVA